MGKRYKTRARELAALKAARVHRATVLITVVIAVAGFVAPVFLGTVRWFTPDVVLSRADLGAFVSASASDSTFGRGVTTIQTTRGSIVAVGTDFTALRGVELELRDTALERVQLCAQGTDVCTRANVPAGTVIVPQPRPRSWLVWCATHFSADNLAPWGLLGLLLSVAMLFVVSETAGEAAAARGARDDD